MRLEIANVKEFKEIIYPEYLHLFTEEERKSYYELEKAIFNNITTIIKIIVESKIVGFMILNILKDMDFIQLDYLGILSKYQRKGYGSEAIKLLYENYKKYKGIFIEVEKEGLGKDKEENEIRKKRVKFYEKLGFYKLNFNIKICTVIYSTYFLKFNNSNISNKKIEKDVLNIYYAILDKKNIEENVKIIN